MMKLYAVRMKSNYSDTNENGNSLEYYIVERSGETAMDEELELEAFVSGAEAVNEAENSKFNIRNTTLDKVILGGNDKLKEFMVDRLLRGDIRVRYQ